MVEAGAARTISGEIFDPGSSVETTTYRIGSDRAAVTGVYHTMKVNLTGTVTGGQLVVTGTDLTGKPVSLRAPAAAGAVLSGPGIGGTVALVDRLTGMKPRSRRTLTSVELGYFPAIELVTARHQVERRPDRGGRRVFAVTTTRGADKLTTRIEVDAGGMVVTRTDGAPVDTAITRRPQ